MYLHMAHSVVNTDQADFAKKVVMAGSPHIAYVGAIKACPGPKRASFGRFPPGGAAR
jgi:hypothetical protein